MIEIKQINETLYEKYKEDIINYYYQNVISNSCRENFKIYQAEEKINGLLVHLKNGNAFCFGAFDASKMVGFIWAYKHSFRDEERIYVNELRINKEYRKQGIAKKLLETIENVALENSISVMYIHAEADNIAAINLYEKFGFLPERIQLRKRIDSYNDKKL